MYHSSGMEKSRLSVFQHTFFRAVKYMVTAKRRKHYTLFQPTEAWSIQLAIKKQIHILEINCASHRYFEFLFDVFSCYLYILVFFFTRHHSYIFAPETQFYAQYSNFLFFSTQGHSVIFVWFICLQISFLTQNTGLNHFLSSDTEYKHTIVFIVYADAPCNRRCNAT